ncbi:MAG: IGHMBP2 family helicase [Planctomycetes bacterium]|nr:IGHMBP2 family helicase [Planctomycetota bacterium]
MPLVYLRSLSRRTKTSDILVFLDQVGGLKGTRVGRIELQAGEAAIEVPDGWESRVAKALNGQLLGDRRVQAWAESPADVRSGAEDHFARLTRLLELESKAEAQEAMERNRRLSAADAERTGTSLVDLVVLDEEAGLGGRYLVRLIKRKGSPLPWTRLGVGSPVVFSAHANKSTTAYRGVVCERTDGYLQVALASMPDEMAEQEVWRLDLSSDEVAVDRQRAALSQVRLARGERLAELRDALLGQRQIQFNAEQDEPPFDASLNETQRAAVRFALSARDLALIHGPPGTGKTTTVVELIRRAIRRGEKVLACAPSNMAVDNIFERLLDAKVRAVRLGHPGRVMPELRAHTLDLLVDDHPDVRLARSLVKEAMSLFRQADRTTRAKPAPGARREARQEAKSLLADAKRLEAQAVEHILDTADVLCATTTGLDSSLLGTRRFDLAVIDEACQSTEPGCWIPLLRCDRVVLSGDHCQLPPTVVSREAADEGFGRSLFERLATAHGSLITRRLSLQYRMHQAIMDFSAEEFYQSELEADATVRNHVLADLPGVLASPLTQSPVDFIDTAGASFDEELEPDGESRLNRQEAGLVCRKVQELLDCGVPAGDIAVIAPYSAQVRLLREQLPIAGLEIDSVDGFQGREKEAVVISLVRSNPQGEIGFLSDERRMNVAMTRARRKLLVIGDSATLSGNAFYKRMIEYFERLGAYRTVWEEGLS